MARKTTKICSLMLSEHDSQRNAILLNKSTTDKEKVLQLREINAMIESLLMKSNCYHGFQYPDLEGLRKVQAEYESTPGSDYGTVVLDSVAENNRMYIGLRDW
ncbi:hypothetical protein XaC1_58 [Xanthomonas phage XaC1]|nr:hypothetical protein XaC1_58 [Xanthomonas phage XaC1]